MSELKKRMNKFWIIAFSAFLLGVSPSVATGVASEEIEMETKAITIAFRGNSVLVSNAEGLNLEIFNLTGVRISTIKIEDNESQIQLNLTKGIYMVKVGKVVRKVTIR